MHDYFQAVGISLRADPYFHARDRAGATPMVLVSETMARQFRPGEDPPRKRLRWGRPPMAAAARHEEWHADPLQTIPEMKSMQEVMDEAVAPQRFYVELGAIFSALALSLGMAGLYSILSYSVGARRYEIAARSPLVACGFARVPGANLSGILPRDAVTFTGVALMMLLVSAWAGYAPAGKAAWTDSMMALREE
jgi:hypothetical protein